LILNGIGSRDLVGGSLVTASFTAMTDGPHLLFTQFGNSGSSDSFGSYGLTLNKTVDGTPWAVRFDPTGDGVEARLVSGDRPLAIGDQISLTFDFLTGPATFEGVQLAVSGSLSSRVEQIAGRAKVVVSVTLGETALLEDILSFRFSGGQGGGEILLQDASVSVRQMFGNFVSAPVDTGDMFTLPSRYTGTDWADTISGSVQADTIWGGADDDLIYGGDGDDALYGGEGDDTVEGGEGNDSIVAGLGTDITSGGLGIDTLDLTSVTAAVTLNMATGVTNGLGTHTGYEIARVGSGNDKVIGTNGSDAIYGNGGDDALYGDGYRSVYDLDDARAVYRLYQATLDRVPDAAGQAGWTELLATDARTLAGVAAGFVGSAEFQSVYGALSNAAFVELLYQNVLGRAADAGGLAGWTNALAGGTSRAQVVTGFS
jgi:Ca2+-binding RTX toxin-like protein